MSVSPADQDTGPRGRTVLTGQTTTISMASGVSWLLVVLGVALRIRQYVFRRSLWNDEASLAINIINRSYGGLTRPLAVVQGAPIGFLWMEKTATEVFGNSEYALRIVPLLSGIASVIIFRNLVWRILPPVAACVAMAPFAVAPALVYYASESKQYGFDLFAAVALAGFLPWLLDGALTRRKCLWWAGATSLLVWCSFPAAFVAGAVSVVVIVTSMYRRDRRIPALFVAACAAWILSFFVEYVVSLRNLHSNSALLGYWAFAFAPRPLTLSSTLSWFHGDLHAIVHFPWSLAVFPLAVALLIGGVAALLFRRPPVGFCILILSCTMAVAAVAHEYPLATRMILFSVPFVCILLGATLLLSRLWTVQLGMAILVLVVTANQFGSAASAVVHPYTKTEVREAYVYALQHERPGDAVLVEWEGIPDYLYYHQTLGVNADGTFRLSGSSSACANAQQLEKLDQWKRVWLIFGIDPDTEQGHPIAHYVAALRSVGRVTATFYSPGPSGAVLLTVSRSGNHGHSAIAAPPWQPASYGCLSVQVATLNSEVTGIRDS